MLEEVLVPIFICVILPVAIVFIVGRVRQNETNRKTEVMLKAIESGAPIDPDMLKVEKKATKPLKKELLDKLTGACITFLMGVAFIVLYYVGADAFFDELLLVAGGVLAAVGIGLFISYFVGKQLLSKEIQEEENTLR